MTGAANWRSASAASSCSSGAVAVTIACIGGSAVPSRSRARKWIGVVTSTRGAGVAASVWPMSAGKNGCPE